MNREGVESRAPCDRYNLAYFFLLLHGIGFLLPWNVFITAKEYFMDYKLNTTLSYDADYRVNFMSYIGFAAHFPGMCFAAWNTFYQSGTRSSKPVLRFVVAMLIEITVLLFTIALTMIDTVHFPGVFFGLTIASVVLINCCVGIHQTLTFGMAAILPMKYSNAVIMGSNACGTIMSIVNILTKWLASVEGRTHKTIVLAAIAYFLSAVTIVIACFVTFFWLRRLPFVLHYVELSNKICIEVFSGTVEQNDGQSALRTVDSSLRSEPQESNSVSDRTIGDPVSYDSRTLSPCRMGGPETESLLVAHERGAMKTGMDNGLDVVRNCFALCCFRPTEGKQRCRAYWSRYVSCLAECWPHCLSVWCVFFCSLSVFPAILSMVRPVDPNYFISPVWFTDVTCFLFFNLFAMIGCIVCNWVQFPGPRYLWIPVWFRALVFIPFFLFCNFGFAEPKLPVLVANDHVYVLGIILFSFTNGYFASLAMMYAPRSCPPERSELTGMLAAFCLILGVCSGVYTSRGLVSIVL